jgi:hypothetical protein
MRVLIAAGLLFAAAADSPQFEAVSVKRSTQEGRRSMTTSPGGLSYVNVTLSDCLRAAYRLERFKIALHREMRSLLAYILR